MELPRIYIPSLKLNGEFPLEKRCLGDNPFVLGFGLFSQAFAVSFREDITPSKIWFSTYYHITPPTHLYKTYHFSKNENKNNLLCLHAVPHSCFPPKNLNKKNNDTNPLHTFFFSWLWYWGSNLELLRWSISLIGELLRAPESSKSQG